MTDLPASALFITVAAITGLVAGPAADAAARRLLPHLYEGYGSSQTLTTAGLSAAAFGLLAWRFGPVLILPAFLFLSLAGIVLSRIDLKHQLLPNRIIIPAFAAGLAMLLIDALFSGHWTNLLTGFVGAGSSFVFYLILAVISPRSLGMGDVKLSALLGLYLGYLSLGSALLGLLLGFIVGAVVGLALISRGKAGLKTSVPFGPSMFAGCIVAVAFGPAIGSAIAGGLFA
ncbi:prepilin peptidase [Arthrobacter sp. 35W]|uniref:prepilin peptidase n=1 Tax=Arthrobacter sp. 35W TaxID=1132441 RepID=UPI000403555B|nr:A24 family peptidase [Arthrobacter sp. 35W]